MRARVIRGAAGGAARWPAPALGTGPHASRAGAARFEAAPGVAPEPAQQHEAGREEGFARGYQDGLEAARAETAASLAALAALTESVRAPLAHADAALDDELARLALAVARAVLGREAATDPESVAAVLREARAALGEVRGRLRIHLNPAQAPHVRRAFAGDAALAAADVVEDPAVACGGCTLACESSFVDATLEARIARIAAQLLGDAGTGGAAP